MHNLLIRLRYEGSCDLNGRTASKARRKGENMSETTKKRVGMAMVPILAIFALGASQGGVNAGLNTMGMAFPEAGANIGYVVSMVALGMIPAGFLSGALTGKYVKYRTTIIIAIICYLISGCFPFFLQEGSSFAVLLVSRFIFGVAVGWSYPLANALTFKLIDNAEQRATWLGVGFAFFNIGTIFMEFGGGYLAMISWQACFLVYLIGIIPLVLVVIMLKEPETDLEQEEKIAAAEGVEADTRVPFTVYLYCILLTLGVTFAMPTILYASMIAAMSFGLDAAAAGLVLSVMTIVGMLCGFTMGPIFKLIGKWIVPVGGIWLGVFFCACAYFCTTGALIPWLVCFYLGHWGFVAIINGTGNWLTNLVPVGAATKTMGIYTAFHQAGCFLATPASTLLVGVLGLAAGAGAQMTVDYVGLMMPASIIVVVVGVLMAILTVFTKQRESRA